MCIGAAVAKGLDIVSGAVNLATFNAFEEDVDRVQEGAEDIGEAGDEALRSLIPSIQTPTAPTLAPQTQGQPTTTVASQGPLGPITTVFGGPNA